MMRPIAIAVLALGLAGCSGGVVVPVPVSDVRPFKPITLSCQDTAPTRQQIIAHNSVYDTLKSGHKIVYKDDCVEHPKPTS